MATKTITTYEHSCDLCGAEHDEDELAHLYGEPDTRPTQGPYRSHPRADICADCQSRPLSELLEYFARDRQPSAAAPPVITHYRAVTAEPTAGRERLPGLRKPGKLAG